MKIAVQCTWVDKSGFGTELPWLRLTQCTKRATQFYQRDDVCWAWCSRHDKMAEHSGGEKQITEQEYLVQSVQNS